MKKSLKTPVPPFILIAILIAVVIVAIVSTNYFNSIDQLVEYARSVTAHYGLWAPVLYILAYALIGLTGFSVTILSLVALGIFDSVTAFFVIIIGASFSAAIAFLLARKSNYDLFANQRKLSHSRKVVRTLASKIESNLSDKPFRSVLLLRFTRLPYIAFSYAAGLVQELPFRPFVAATVASNALSALVYVLFGAILLSYIAGITLVLAIGLVAYYTWPGRHKKNYS